MLRCYGLGRTGKAEKVNKVDGRRRKGKKFIRII